jgi:hypothetical protein
MSNIFKDFLNKVAETDSEDKLTEAVGFLDNSNVVLLVPKNNTLKRVIENNYELNKRKSEKTLTKSFIKGLTGDAVFSLEYLKNIIKILNRYDDAVRIRIGKDYPMIIENNAIAFVLAPRIETEKDKYTKVDELPVFKEFQENFEKEKEEKKKIEEEERILKKKKELEELKNKKKEIEEKLKAFGESEVIDGD